MASLEIVDLLKPNDYDQNVQRYGKVRVVIISDTHGNHQMVNIPAGDIFLHCGDFTNRHDWCNLSDNQIPQSIISFNQWLGKLPHRYKIVICGNHEIDQFIEIEGISIYGSPWPFNEPYRSKWSSIPSHIDILMTHIPPQYILDLAFQPKKSPSNEPCSMCDNAMHGPYGHWGSKTLLNEIIKKNSTASSLLWTRARSFWLQTQSIRK